MSTMADCKNYANMVASLTGIDIINDFLTNNVDNVKKLSSNPSNLKANYGLDSNNAFSNAIIPDIISDYGKDHNIDEIESFIHSPSVIGGSMEDYAKANVSVQLFKEKRGLIKNQDQEEVLEEDSLVRTRTR